MNLRWIFLIIAAFLSQRGIAQDGTSLDERLDLLEERKGYFHKKGEFQGIAEGNLLYWKADVDGVAYDTTTVALHATDGGIGNVGTNYKTRTPHFAYDPGFRLMLGFQSPYDFFDVSLVWTRFYTKGRDEAHGALVPALTIPGEKLISLGIGLIQSLSSIPNSASAECGIKGNLLDLRLGRGIQISHPFFMRPYFGVRGVWSDVHWDISIDRTFIVPGIFGQDSTQLKVKNDFHAAGGLIGLELDWKLPYGFGINARGAGALVYGLTEEKTKQMYTFLPSPSTTSMKQNFHAHNSFYSVKGLWELFMGIFWDSHKPRKKGQKKQDHPDLRLFVGYEFQQWPYIAQKTNTQATRQRERFSLGFQGFTGGARVTF